MHCEGAKKRAVFHSVIGLHCCQTCYIAPDKSGAFANLLNQSQHSPPLSP